MILGLCFVVRYRDNFPNILKLVDGLQELGKKYGATAGQVSLAWLLAQGDDIIPIPGTKGIKVRRLSVDLKRSIHGMVTVVSQRKHRCQ
jgi:aryl-alcohol dehydrogenase-like predicted oxidoreductase